MRTELIKKYIVDKYDYDRMISHDCDCIDDKKTYDDFVKWNIQCMLECDAGEYILIEQLCKKIKNRTVAQMDLESCAVFDSSNIFFGIKKNLVIVNPR